jgi:mono/diheme cytochrome c family protein
MTKFIFSLLISVLFFASVSEAKKDPTLTIKSGKITKKLKRADLLKLPGLKEMTAPGEPTYTSQTIKYKAVPMKEVFKGIKYTPGSIVQFKCLDGYSAPLASERLLNEDPNGAIAYLAIEPADQKWPFLKNGKDTAGPFYVIWENPQKSKIGPEEWPFQLVSFEFKTSLKSQFPNIFPKDGLAKDGEVMKGFAGFQKNCFACHTLNKEGASKVGPDLNLPFNPTEYMEEEYLVKLIRNPQDVRHWPQSKMPGFKKEDLSDDDIHDIVGYLEHMADRKVKAK